MMAKSVLQSDTTSAAKGNGVLHVTSKRKLSRHEDEPSPKPRMCISLHNQSDDQYVESEAVDGGEVWTSVH